LITGETDIVKMAELAQRRLRAKIPQLQLALEGYLTEHHRFMLRLHLDHVRAVDTLIGRMKELMLTFTQEAELLDEIPGINQATAQAVIAEIGTNLAQFPQANQLASWAGLGRGNDVSAGKRRSG
jgi:transposase